MSTRFYVTVTAWAFLILALMLITNFLQPPGAYQYVGAEIAQRTIEASYVDVSETEVRLQSDIDNLTQQISDLQTAIAEQSGSDSN